MPEIFFSFSRLFDWRSAVDIILVAMIFYVLLRLFRGTQAIQLMRGILVIALVIAVVSQMTHLTAFNWLLRNSTMVVLVAIPVIFQPELRRALERVGRTAPLAIRRADSAGIQRLVNEVVLAVEHLAERKHGALIVFEGSTGLADVVDRGVPIHANVTMELITTIFFPNTALHDGAVIIRGNELVAAGCVLPLTQRELSDLQMGTRHRAAIGITEESDAMCVVVSEETGLISVARNGRILRLGSNRLRTLLSDYYGPQPA